MTSGDVAFDLVKVLGMLGKYLEGQADFSEIQLQREGNSACFSKRPPR